MVRVDESWTYPSNRPRPEWRVYPYPQPEVIIVPSSTSTGVCTYTIHPQLGPEARGTKDELKQLKKEVRKLRRQIVRISNILKG